MDERKVETPVDVVLDSLEAERPRFRPAVGRVRPRVRIGFVVLLLCTLSAAAVVLLLRLRGEDSDPAHAAGPGTWWSRAGSQCTPLGVQLAIRDPAWSEVERTTCLAIAGKIDDARTRLAAMSAEQRSAALQQIFAIAHPIADAGDDRSAGPIMGLIAEQWPENYMAVFHAGMAEFALGNDDAARIQLDRFLTMYGREDVWRGRAQKALTDIVAGVPLAQREAHFPE